MGPTRRGETLTDVADAVHRTHVFGDQHLPAHSIRNDLPRHSKKIVRTSVAETRHLARARQSFAQRAEVIVNMGLAEDGVYVQTLDGGIGRLFRMAHRRGASL